MQFQVLRKINVEVSRLTILINVNSKLKYIQRNYRRSNTIYRDTII